MTTELSTERLAEIAVEYGDMAERLSGSLEDGPGAASAFYMSCSLGEVSAMATELKALRSAVVDDAAVERADEQSLIDAYLRGIEWRKENPTHTDYPFRFKAARDYADKALTAALVPGHVAEAGKVEGRIDAYRELSQWHVGLAAHEEALAIEYMNSGLSVDGNEHVGKAKLHRAAADFIDSLAAALVQS